MSQDISDTPNPQLGFVEELRARRAW